MLYTLIGNGDANQKEVVLSLESLHQAASTRIPEDEFWMILIQDGEPSATTQAVVQFLDNHSLYYEVVLPENTDPHEQYQGAKVFHTARRLYDRAVALSRGRVQEGENRAILILSNDMDSDDGLLYAIGRSIDLGIPVFDLGGQMMQVMLEQVPIEEEEEEEVEEEEPVVEIVAIDQEINATIGMDEVTHADLMSLTRDELKNLVTIQKVVPSDMRSKESMVDALMNNTKPVEPVEEQLVLGDPLTFIVEAEPTVHVHSVHDDGTITEDDIVAKTKSGAVLTEEDLDALADEAEQGYDIQADPVQYLWLALDADGTFVGQVVSTEKAEVIRTLLEGE